MAQLLQETFEAGLTQWPTTVVVNGSTPVTVTTIAKTGTHSCLFKTNPTLALANSQIAAPVNERNLYVRGYFYAAQGPQSFMSYDRFAFIRIADSSGSTIASVAMRREADPSPVRWALWRRTSGAGETYAGSHIYGVTPVVNTTPRWICIELHYNADLRLYELFIDGVLEATITAAPTTAAFVNAATVQIGINKTGTSGQPYDPTGLYTAEVYADNVIFAQEYIGTGVVIIPPKLTVNSSPELNVPVYVDGSFVGNTPITIEVPAGTHTVRVESEVTR